MEACSNCDREMVETLLSWGAKVNASTDSWRNTPMLSAVCAFPEPKNDLERFFDSQEWKIKLLVQAGALINEPHRDHNPLYVAIRRRDIRVARQLLEAGADPNLLIYKVYYHPIENICLEAARGNIKMFALLREYGAKP